MLHRLKKRLYFLVAAYFAFWAKFVLRRWSPRVILITGSSGKTTMLHLTESQLGDQAFYSHDANSLFGLAFQLLGLGTNVASPADWVKRLVKAPLHIFNKPSDRPFYVVEADCDRPQEGRIISKFIKPEVVIWVSVSNTHSVNFESLVKDRQFPSVSEAIAYEFGNYAAAAKKLVLANGDQPLLVSQLKRVKEGVEVKKFSAKAIKSYSVKTDGVSYNIDGKNVSLNALQPKETGVSIQMLMSLMNYLSLDFDPRFTNLVLPPGRSRMFKGKKSTTLIDSTYNTGLKATEVLIDLFVEYPAKKKWLVVSDILEQGSLDKSEHEQLAKYILPLKFDKVIFNGERSKKYAYPILEGKYSGEVLAFDKPKELLDYVLENISGGEVILFKGAKGLETVVEELLLDPNDADQLVRRSKTWVKRRQSWGLPR